MSDTPQNIVMVDPPMMGSVRGRVLGVKGVSIHGDTYCDCVIGIGDSPDGRIEAIGVRIPMHLLTGDLHGGETLSVEFLMGQVQGVEVL
ncbi:MAG: hypothetical protein AAGD00_00745 [Planctomycetota bacterium]